MKNSLTLKKIAAAVISIITVLTLFAPTKITSHAENGNLIIMLDPGHGGNDGGAENTVDGVYYNENNLMLKVANYAKSELSQYPGVTVLMTRESTETYLTLAQRVSKATANGAHAIISIHANSYSGSSARGAEALVACGNYRPEVAAATQSIGTKILSQLESIGLKNRGLVKKLDNQGEIIEYYPDGSHQDYYGIVQRAIRGGIPGVIIETAFISNESDVRNHFSSDSKLQTLGKAIATGIAKHYGLSKSTTASATARPHVDARTLTFDGTPDTAFLYPLNSTKITQGNGYATLSQSSGGIKAYIDYRGMAFSADTYKYAVIRMRSSAKDATAIINTGAHEITYDTPEFTYKATLDTDFQNIVIDMTESEDWTLAVNFIKIQISGTSSADIEYIKFCESKTSAEDSYDAIKPTAIPTQKPTAKPTSTAAPQTDAPTETPISTVSATNTISSPAPTIAPTDIAAQTMQAMPTESVSPATPDNSPDSESPKSSEKGELTKTVVIIIILTALTAIFIIMLLKQLKKTI